MDCEAQLWTIRCYGPHSPCSECTKPSPVPFTVYTNLALNCLLLSSLVLIEHLANAKMCAQKSKMPLDENHELFVLGLSNIFGGLFSELCDGGGFRERLSMYQQVRFRKLAFYCRHYLQSSSLLPLPPRLHIFQNLSLQ